MATYRERLADFNTDRFPAEGVAVELLCNDHVGTYLLPFACCRKGEAWCNLKTGEVIEADVAGWREKPTR